MQDNNQNFNQEQINFNQNQASPDYNQYQAPYYNQNMAPIVSMGDWILTILLLMIPIVNLILLLVWAFSPSTNPSKANLFKAYLIMLGSIIALTMIIAVLSLISLPFS